MIIVGGLLLLPGICALLFAQSRISYTIYAAGFVGLILVFWALQRLRR
jgi:ABC-type Mn2+/Zn2+ transport system permease subunit